MQVLDSLIDGPLLLSNTREGDELIGMIVRFLRTGSEPTPRTDAQRMALAMVQPVLEKSRARIEAGSEGGSKPSSKRVSKTPSKPVSKQPSKSTSKTVSKTENESISKTLSKEESKPSSKRVSDIYSSSSIPLPEEEDRGSGGKEEEIPYSEIVQHLNDTIGASYKASSAKTRSLIHARWQEGFRLEDFKQVIDTMFTVWENDPKMCAYLRPETLFGTKFESYLNRFKPTGKEASHAERDVYSYL